MSIWRRLINRYQSAKLEADVKYGRKTWGRQPQKGHATISAVVIRADGRVEDLGVLAEGEVEFRPSQFGR